MGLVQTLSLSFSLFLGLPTAVELLLLKIKRLVDYFFFLVYPHYLLESYPPFFSSFLCCFALLYYTYLTITVEI